MDKDTKSALIIFTAFLIIMITICAVITISHEITETGDAKRCAEYNYKCDNN